MTRYHVHSQARREVEVKTKRSFGKWLRKLLDNTDGRITIDASVECVWVISIEDEHPERFTVLFENPAKVVAV